MPWLTTRQKGDPFFCLSWILRMILLVLLDLKNALNSVFESNFHFSFN